MATEESKALLSWAEWLTLGQGLIGLVIGWVWWSLHKVFMKRKDCDACRDNIEERLDTLHERRNADAAQQDALKQALAGLPTAQNMTDLRISLERLSGRIDAVQKEIEGQGDILTIVRQQSDRTHAFLLERGK